MWIPPEVDDPVCLHAPTRKSISFFGAVRLKDGKLVMSRPNGMFDARTCWDFYRKLERRPGNVILHHRTVHPVVIREWSTPMDNYSGAIWQAQRTEQRFKRRSPRRQAESEQPLRHPAA